MLTCFGTQNPWPDWGGGDKRMWQCLDIWSFNFRLFLRFPVSPKVLCLSLWNPARLGICQIPGWGRLGSTQASFSLRSSRADLQPCPGMSQNPSEPEREAATLHSGSQEDLEGPPTHSKRRWTPGSAAERVRSQNLEVLHPLRSPCRFLRCSIKMEINCIE